MKENEKLVFINHINDKRMKKQMPQKLYAKHSESFKPLFCNGYELFIKTKAEVHFNINLRTLLAFMEENRKVELFLATI